MIPFVCVCVFLCLNGVYTRAQHVAIRHLEDRVTRAIKLCRADESIPDLDSLVVCGGVAANQQVRSRLLALAEKMEILAVFPPGESRTAL